MFEEKLPMIEEPKVGTDIFSIVTNVVNGIAAYNNATKGIVKEVSVIYNKDKEKDIVNFQFTYKRYPVELSQTVAVQ